MLMQGCAKKIKLELEKKTTPIEAILWLEVQV